MASGRRETESLGDVLKKKFKLLDITHSGGTRILDLLEHV
jgi:hypothetical protein